MKGLMVSILGRAAGIGVAVSLLAGCSSGSVGSSARSQGALPSSKTVATGAVAGLHAAVAGLDVASENAKAGTGSWRITRLGRPSEIEGFATRTDIVPGEPLRLAVSTTAASYRVHVYRAGWYGGRLMREVWSSGVLPGHRQATATLSEATYTVLTSWRPNEVIDTKEWPPGAYLVRLDASTGGQRYVPVTMRSTNARDAVVLLDAVTTWQAYNAWGRYSLYHGPGGEADFSHRSRVVTFDRPYEGDGSGDFLPNELPAISLAERAGLPLAYATDVALDQDPHLLDRARGLVSMAHDEYWSTKMRTQVTVARDRGVNVAFLGANAVFRHIRFEAGPVGDGADRADRMEVNYKRRFGDPYNGRNDAEVTVDWREPPVPRPESTLTGTFYECNPVLADLIVTDPSSWLWVGIARVGTKVPGVIGNEYDRVNPGVPTPAGIEVLTHSPVTCRNTHSYSDSAYYTTPSGAGVFNSGTNLWVPALGGPGLPNVTTPKGSRIIQAVTLRLLQAMADGPMGRVHAARGNSAALHAYRGDPIAAHAAG
jgi:hypothetical protein